MTYGKGIETTCLTRSRPLVSKLALPRNVLQRVEIVQEAMMHWKGIETTMLQNGELTGPIFVLHGSWLLQPRLMVAENTLQTTGIALNHVQYYM